MIVPGIRYIPGRNDYTDRDSTKYGIAIHNTSNDAPASGEASYATRRTDGVSAHFYVDDREVIQSVDTRHRTGHAGSYEGNEHAISVEITGTNAKPREWWIANVAWDQLGRTLAVVCRAYSIELRRASVAEMRDNPRVRAFYSHDDMRQAWGGTTHTDPGGNFPWDHLFAAVKAHLSQNPEEEDTMPTAREVVDELLARPLPSSTLGTYTVADHLKGGRLAVRDLSAVRAEVTTVRLAQQAILDAVRGVDTAAILGRIDEHAQAEAARDAELAELVRAGQAGELDAAEVVRRIGELLTAAPPQG